MWDQRHLSLENISMAKLSTGASMLVCAPALKNIVLKNFNLVVLEGFVKYTLHDFHLPVGRKFMTKSETPNKSQVDKTFRQAMLPMFRSFGISVVGLVVAFARYAVETFLAVALFGVLVVASWIARWLNVTIVGNSIPELVRVFKYLEFFLLSVGILLLVVFIIRNTIMFITPLVGDIMRVIHSRDKKYEVSSKKKAE